MDEEEIRVKWFEIDAFEHRSFATMKSYKITIQREAIPIIFVPGIMGSRLLNATSQDSVWDPDDPNSLAKNYFARGGQHRKDLLIGPSFSNSYLSVAGGRFGKPQDALGAAFAKREFSGWYAQEWSWAQKDENVTEQAYFDSSSSKNSSGGSGYTLDDHILQFTSPEKVQESFDGLSDNAKQMSHEAQIALKNGWAGVAWSFYGEIICKIANNRWSEAGLRKYFYFPTYAFGYNWTQSNRTSGAQLAEYIQAVIQAEAQGGRLCNYVILVTHSMGGLVARACSELASSRNKILGIVHGAQPAVGTPAAYHQVRAGQDVVPLPIRKFWNTDKLKEYAATQIMGPDAGTIDPIFGHAPGPAELLPAPSYKTNKSNVNPAHRDSPQWLYETGPQHAAALPVKGSPFDSIYDNDADFRGLPLDAPNVLPDSENERVTAFSRNKSAADAFRQTLTIARDFHADLQRNSHPVTYYSYSYNLEAKTYDEITYQYMRQHMQDTSVVLPDGGTAVITDPQTTGQGFDVDPKTQGLYQIAPKTGSGDGTVAASSATSLGAPGGLRPPLSGETPDLSYPPHQNIIRIKAVPGLEHSGIYQNEAINNFTLQAITEIASNYCAKKVGKATKPLWTP